MKRYRCMTHHVRVDEQPRSISRIGDIPLGAAFIILESDDAYHYVISGSMVGWIWADQRRLNNWELAGNNYV